MTPLTRGLRALFVFLCVLVCCLGNDYPQAKRPGNLKAAQTPSSAQNDTHLNVELLTKQILRRP